MNRAQMKKASTEELVIRYNEIKAARKNLPEGKPSPKADKDLQILAAELTIRSCMGDDQLHKLNK